MIEALPGLVMGVAAWRSTVETLWEKGSAQWQLSGHGFRFAGNLGGLPWHLGGTYLLGHVCLVSCISICGMDSLVGKERSSLD